MLFYIWLLHQPFPTARPCWFLAFRYVRESDVRESEGRRYYINDIPAQGKSMSTLHYE